MYFAHFLSFWKIYNVLVGLLKISEAGTIKEVCCCYLQLLCKSSSAHFLWVYRRNKATWDVWRTPKMINKSDDRPLV